MISNSHIATNIDSTDNATATTQKTCFYLRKILLISQKAFGLVSFLQEIKIVQLFPPSFSVYSKVDTTFILEILQL